MTSKVGKRPLRSLSAHEKMEAIRRVHDGESKASVARDIGVPESTLRGWCKNEDKILYLSRQSTPETDDSDHLQPTREKKPRYDDIASLQPYNLSVRGASNSPPPAVAVVAEAVESSEVDAQLPTALNLTKQQDTPKTASIITPTPTISASDRERERNRAELARLSVELGLNRPEMFLPNANLAANLSDLSTLTANLGLVAQWNSALLQQVTANNTVSTTSSTKKRTTTSAGLDSTSQINPVVTSSVPTSTSAPSVTTTHHNNNNNHYNNNINKSNQKVKKTHAETAPVDDSVWYWLKTQQAMLGLVQNQGQNNVDPNSSWFWKWYKQLAYSQQLPQQPILPQQQSVPHQVNNITTTPEKPILYQQLTKDSNLENLVKSEMKTEIKTEIKTDETPKSTKTNPKVRAVLDNLLLNNNNNDDSSPVNNVVDDVTKDVKPEESTPVSTAEALNHGEMFLKWLEKCGDPSVTAVQILQFRYLLNNVRMGADRKNGAENMKTKVRSRK